MERISIIISEIYNKFLPLTEKGEIRLDLDLGTHSETVDNVAEITHDIESQLEASLQRSPKGHITIAVRDHKVIITDTGTTLSRTMCALLSTGRIFVRSRTGFGTTVEIDISKHESPETDQSL